MSVNRAPNRVGIALTASFLLFGLVFVGPQSLAGPAGAAAPEQSAAFARAMDRLPAGAHYEALVRFRRATRSEGTAFLAAHGLDTIGFLSSIDVALATGDVAAFRALRSEPSIAYLEDNSPIRMLDETSSWASRAQVAQEPVAGGPYRDPDGNIVDGSGVGVAVVDSGINGAHPDLVNRVVRNFKWICGRIPSVEAGGVHGDHDLGGPCVMGPSVPDSDTSSGHGTHVAGIIAGDGTASRGTFKGVAPGAALYGFGVGEYRDIFAPAAAFDYILQHYDDTSIFPTPIKVINNSWAGGSGFSNPGDAIAMLADQLIDQGVTVVWAAANSGGDGTLIRTSTYCNNPTPGVICAANYDDGATANRNLGLAATSSRGLAGSPETYPDISAPGTNITSTCIEDVQPVCLSFEPRYAPFYATLSGTSMASPHIAGVAALLYQADPSLTPAELEDVLLDTAHKFTFGATYEADPQNPDGTTSFDKGAGLVDVKAALDALAVAHDDAHFGPFSILIDPAFDAAAGSADVVGLTATEETTGMRYGVELRAAADVPTTIYPTIVRLYQNIDGVTRVTAVSLTSAGTVIPPRDTQNTAVASEVTVEGNTLSFLVPFSELGSPSDDEIATNVQVQTWQPGAAADVAPGGTWWEKTAIPQYGHAYTIHPT